MLSKSLTLILALSTRTDKVEGVEKTLEFANIITQISNEACGNNDMSGGGKLRIKKNKYKLIK